MTRRRLLLALVWLLGAAGLGWSLWPSRYRPWPLPPGAGVPVPGTHFLDHTPPLDEGRPPDVPPAVAAVERWDLDTGRLAAVRRLDAPLRLTQHWAGDGRHVNVVPAGSPAGPTTLTEWPPGRELVRHPGVVHLFPVGGPGDDLYAVGEPADPFRQAWELKAEDLRPPRVVHIHDRATGRRLRTLPGASPRLPAVCGRRVVTVTPREEAPRGVERTIHVWDVTDGRELLAVRYPAEHGPMFIFLSADGRTLMTSDGAAWDVATGATRRPGRLGPTATVTADNRWLVQADADGTVRWLDTATGAERVGPERVPTISVMNGGAYGLNRWGADKVYSAAQWTPRPGRVRQWLTDRLPALARLSAGQRAETRILDPATGRTVLSAPVYALYGGTDDGELLFVADAAGRQSLYYTGPVVPWAAGAAVAGWTLAVLLVARRGTRR